MTKKAFYERISGKEVVIDNLEEIKKIATEEKRNKLIWYDKNGFLKDYKKKGFKFFYEVEEDRIYMKGYKKDKHNNIILDSSYIHYINLMNIHSRGLKTEVRSKDIIVNGVHFDKKNIEILSENTFKTQFSQCIYKIID